MTSQCAPNWLFNICSALFTDPQNLGVCVQIPRRDVFLPVRALLLRKKARRGVDSDFAYVVHFSCGPRGAGIRRLTGNRKLKATYTKRERLIRHTGQSGHGSGDSSLLLVCLHKSQRHLATRAPQLLLRIIHYWLIQEVANK